jgi:hypothetical protein
MANRGEEMARILRRVGSVALAAVSCLGLVAMTAPAAGAYGKVGRLDTWQIGLSFNCNNADFCGSDGLGGFWGWVQFTRDPVTGVTDADAVLEGCGHSIGGGGGGAGHTVIDVNGWIIAPGSAGPHTFWATGGTETDSFRGQTVTGPLTNEDGSLVTPANPNDTGIPADPGHYGTSDIFGFDAPAGVAFQVQVAYKPAR